MRRCWEALVVLIGVFAMHGLQCVGHDRHPVAGHGVAQSLVSVSLPAAPDAVDLPTAAHVPSASAAPDHARHAAVPPLPPGESSSPLPADFWAVCLAVLAAGLVLLAAVLMPRAPAARDPSPFAALVRWASAPALLRPPDLFALCVMRN